MENCSEPTSGISIQDRKLICGQRRNIKNLTVTIRCYQKMKNNKEDRVLDPSRLKEVKQDF